MNDFVSRAGKVRFGVAFLAFFVIGCISQPAAAAKAEADSAVQINYEDIESYIIRSSPAYLTTYNETKLKYDTMREYNIEYTNCSVEYHYWGRAYEKGVENGLSQPTLDSYLKNQAAAYQGMSLIEDKLANLEEDIGSNQIVLDAAAKDELVTAQNLFLTHHKLKAQTESANKSFASLAKERSLLEKQYELGLVSKSELKAKDQEIMSEEKSLTSLAKESNDNMIGLKVLLGIDPDAAVTLGDPPEIDLSGIKRLDYEEDLALYLANQDSIEVKYDALVEAVKKDKSTYIIENAQIAYSQAQVNAKLAFERIYNSLIDGYSDYLSSQTDLDQAETALKIVKMKKDLGLVSQKEYDTSEAGLVGQRVSLMAEKIELYEQLNTYLSSLESTASDSDD